MAPHLQQADRQSDSCPRHIARRGRAGPIAVPLPRAVPLGSTRGGRRCRRPSSPRSRPAGRTRTSTRPATRRGRDPRAGARGSVPALALTHHPEDGGRPLPQDGRPPISRVISTERRFRLRLAARNLYAVRFASPSPRDSMGVPQRRTAFRPTVGAPPGPVTDTAAVIALRAHASACSKRVVGYVSKQAPGAGAPARASPRATCSRYPRRGAGRRAPRRRAVPGRRPQPPHDILDAGSRVRGGRGGPPHGTLLEGEHGARSTASPPRSRRAARARAPTMRRTPRPHAPTPVHPGWLRSTTPPSAQQEMLADRLDRLEDATVDSARDARRLAPRVRALRLDALADEGLEAATRGGRIALGHQGRAPLGLESSALKIASENVGYGWIVSRRTSIGVSARTASVSWPIHSPASGPTATSSDEDAATRVRGELLEAGAPRTLVGRQPPAVDQ